MSTRCHIGVYETTAQDVATPDVLLYRHSDGYPGTPDGAQCGVLADIVPFLRWWHSARGHDTEYMAARLLQFLCNEYDAGVLSIHADMRAAPSSASQEWRRHTIQEDAAIRAFTGTLGYGICRPGDFHGDIAYYYAVYPDRVEVYEVPWDNFQGRTLVGTHPLSEGA